MIPGILAFGWGALVAALFLALVDRAAVRATRRWRRPPWPGAGLARALLVAALVVLPGVLRPGLVVPSLLGFAVGRNVLLAWRLTDGR